MQKLIGSINVAPTVSDKRYPCQIKKGWIEILPGLKFNIRLKCQFFKFNHRTNPQYWLLLIKY
jgi:hypothetical protein